MQKYLDSFTSLSAVAVDGNGTAILIENADSFTVFFSYTMSGGSPSADLNVEISPDGTNYYLVNSVTKTATGKYAFSSNNTNAKYVRAVVANRAVTVAITATVMVGSSR